MCDNQKGILVVVSGFSGVGKGTMMKKLMKEHKEDYALSVSATTRSPRPGEVDGKSYFFVTKEKFEDMISQDKLIEYAQYVGNYYGTPKDYVFDQLKAGKSVILEIEIQGALKIKEKFPDTRLLFVTAPSADDLKKRLVGRGTETEEVIANRLKRASEECEGIEKYDYLVINDNLSEAVDKVHSIIQNSRFNNLGEIEQDLIINNTEYIKEMKSELKGFSKGE
ncbi:guanylate kinase [Lachnospiraceae bacterium C7]|nr:guanylate kinase [Lachnospiraceae bacterium C7]